MERWEGRWVDDTKKKGTYGRQGGWTANDRAARVCPDSRAANYAQEADEGPIAAADAANSVT